MYFDRGSAVTGVYILKFCRYTGAARQTYLSAYAHCIAAVIFSNEPEKPCSGASGDCHHPYAVTFGIAGDRIAGAGIGSENGGFGAVCNSMDRLHGFAGR